MSYSLVRQRLYPVPGLELPGPGHVYPLEPLSVEVRQLAEDEAEVVQRQRATLVVHPKVSYENKLEETCYNSDK